ncbi:phosphatidylinositol 3,4,5-trisphosphate 5-phosphatase 1-like isoform X3 [Pempheris klunzingeri]|uniref:phosphatidylinositol 3,4,5-trisphosphate 5-phosphatase 1-like isoform X3 n=1 Tax=Pempheris klunzingeri TaxID=3127111 RepID=UPI0039813BAD
MGACLRGSMEREGALVQSIYYGRIGSEATESLLERFGHEGSFLLRDSQTVPGAYCLCVRLIHHIGTCANNFDTFTANHSEFSLYVLQESTVCAHLQACTLPRRLVSAAGFRSQTAEF